MTSDILERVLLCPRTAFISNEIVDLQRVQCVSMSATAYRLRLRLLAAW